MQLNVWYNNVCVVGERKKIPEQVLVCPWSLFCVYTSDWIHCVCICVVISRGPLLSPPWRSKLVSSCTLPMKAFVKTNTDCKLFLPLEPCCLLVEGKHNVGVLYREQIADFSAQGLESSRVFFFFVLVTEKQSSFLFVCWGELEAPALSHSVTVSDATYRRSHLKRS